MTFPTIADLPLGAVANDSDQMLLRQPAGSLGQDLSITVAQIRNLNIDNLQPLPLSSTPLPTDRVLISRGNTNHRANFRDVGFIPGVKIYFYQSSPPVGWDLDPDIADDTLLGVRSSSGTYTQAGVIQGNWLLPNMTLSVAQIPQHNHTVTGANAASGTGNVVLGNRVDFTVPIREYETNFTGNSQPHNHGDTFRPLARIGVIGIKRAIT